jgi:hypothetical protein
MGEPGSPAVWGSKPLAKPFCAAFWLSPTSPPGRSSCLASTSLRFGAATALAFDLLRYSLAHTGFGLFSKTFSYGLRVFGHIE